MAAGPVFNFIMAFVLSVIIVGAVGYEPSRVLSVKEGSAAETAGLKEGDIITSYQGYHIDLGKDLYVYSYLNELKEGDTINLTVKRDGKKMDISYKSDTNVRYLLGCNFNGDGGLSEIYSGESAYRRSCTAYLFTRRQGVRDYSYSKRIPHSRIRFYL